MKKIREIIEKIATIGFVVLFIGSIVNIPVSGFVTMGFSLAELWDEAWNIYTRYSALILCLSIVIFLTFTFLLSKADKNDTDSADKAMEVKDGRIETTN